MIKMGRKNEFIFAIAFDGIHTKNGGTTFLHAPVGGTMKASEFGINGGWGGLRTTSAFVDKFDQIQQTPVGNFIKMGKLRRSKTLGTLQDGYAIQFRNVDVMVNKVLIKQAFLRC
jgi:hypothetical protein